MTAAAVAPVLLAAGFLALLATTIWLWRSAWTRDEAEDREATVRALRSGEWWDNDGPDGDAA